eukprot:gnl/TRDRNA2_/TRDRNA2_169786_c0_seq1.p1 gnl/TRDRNA2_/TRDRNA2_169786_c0~~gnl/TRDRNA2_/TRDRNA2_169786_c0_seq1.p1  ORF type:complete len:839 (-),score=181.25 gnl/TRDRNA2_/TRDRNA2_169786_c0_seq1:40-2523(-)
MAATQASDGYQWAIQRVTELEVDLASAVGGLERAQADGAALRDIHSDLVSAYKRLQEQHERLRQQLQTEQEERHQLAAEQAQQVSLWRAQLEAKAKEFEELQAQLAPPRELDAIRLQLAEEIEEPYLQRVRALEGRLGLEQRKAADAKRHVEVQRMENLHREQELADQAHEQAQTHKMKEQELEGKIKNLEAEVRVQMDAVAAAAHARTQMHDLQAKVTGLQRALMEQEQQSDRERATAAEEMKALVDEASVSRRRMHELQVQLEHEERRSAQRQTESEAARREQTLLTVQLAEARAQAAAPQATEESERLKEEVAQLRSTLAAEREQASRNIKNMEEKQHAAALALKRAEAKVREVETEHVEREREMHSEHEEPSATVHRRRRAEARASILQSPPSSRTFEKMLHPAFWGPQVGEDSFSTPLAKRAQIGERETPSQQPRRDSPRMPTYNLFAANRSPRNRKTPRRDSPKDFFSNMHGMDMEYRGPVEKAWALGNPHFVSGVGWKTPIGGGGSDYAGTQTTPRLSGDKPPPSLKRWVPYGGSNRSKYTPQINSVASLALPTPLANQLYGIDEEHPSGDEVMVEDEGWNMMEGTDMPEMGPLPPEERWWGFRNTLPIEALEALAKPPPQISKKTPRKSPRKNTLLNARTPPQTPKKTPRKSPQKMTTPQKRSSPLLHDVVHATKNSTSPVKKKGLSSTSPVKTNGLSPRGPLHKRFELTPEELQVQGNLTWPASGPRRSLRLQLKALRLAQMQATAAAEEEDDEEIEAPSNTPSPTMAPQLDSSSDELEIVDNQFTPSWLTRPILNSTDIRPLEILHGIYGTWVTDKM